MCFIFFNPKILLIEIKKWKKCIIYFWDFYPVEQFDENVSFNYVHVTMPWVFLEVSDNIIN